MNQITKDNIVQLETNSPKMTVIGVDTNGYAYCSWTNKRGDEMRGSFPTQSLKKFN
ncbi:hypothetical protein [Aquimarina megaterium]|uniref:hypothetical protein n=1 Tax=Aquimarina megaterium TaxID=1443666 RepID=UPI001586A6BE|nr:hypothetical protein [Aquimarina megaterium]